MSHWYAWLRFKVARLQSEFSTIAFYRAPNLLTENAQKFSPNILRAFVVWVRKFPAKFPCEFFFEFTDELLQKRGEKTL